MGIGNFLKGIVAQVIPGGKTYGSYNPPKKKPQPGDPGYVAPAPQKTAPQQTLSVQAPQNHFDTGITQLKPLGAPKNTANPLGGNTDLSPILKPQPGQVIKPTNTLVPAQPANQPKPGYQAAPGVTGTRATVNGQTGVMATNKVTGQPHFVPDAPKPQDNRFWQKVGRGFKTAGETAVGTVANVPEVGLAAVRAGTSIVQGVGQLPHMATAATATATKKLNEVAPAPLKGVTSAINTGAQGLNTGIKTATHYAIDDALDPINRTIDRAAKGYATHVPMAAGGEQAYHATQVPINVLAALLTAGGSTAAEGAGAAGEAGQGGRIASVVNKFSDILNKPLTSNSDNIVAKTSQAVSNRTTPVVQALNTPISSTRNAVTRFIGNNRSVAPLERDVIDAGEAGNIMNGVEDLTRPPTQIPVTQPQSIDVNAPPSQPYNVPVTVMPRPVGQPIRELAGDTPGAVNMPTPEEVAASRARTAFDSQAPGRPDPSVDGVTTVPRPEPFRVNPESAASSQDDVISQYADMLKSMGEGNGTQLVPDGEGGYIRTSNNFRTANTKGARMTKQDWLDEAERQLKAGQAEPGHQQMFNDAADPEVQSLLAKGDQTEEAPVGKPIRVKQVTGIPVEDKTVVPTDSPETPGQVRVTDSTAPNNAKSDAVASTPTVAKPVQLPKEVQDVLDNPKQFNKRQVAAARNQRKLARQMAKTQEDTAAAIDRIETASPRGTSPEGFTSTGEFGKSANGGAYQKVGRKAEMQQAVHETANISPGDAIKTARENQATNGGFNRRDIRNIQAMFETKRIPRGTPEWQEARQILKEDGTIQAQGLALRGGNVIRRTASPTELMSQYESKIYRLADDPSKIDSKMFDDVEAATTKFTDARDAATQAYNRFTEAPTSANAKTYHAAQDAAEQADKESKMTEFKVAQKVLKGNKDTKQVRELQKMAQNADMYQMDAVDASMLSGTGTFARNFVNSAVGGSEEGLFGGIASRIANKLTGENVGGGFGRGSIRGFKQGAANVVDASKARASNAGWNPLEHIKNWATTGNQLGDTVIDSQVTHNVLDHYTQVLKDEGYKGRELTDRAGVMARQDPDDVGKVYAGYAKAAAGLGSGITKGSKIETVIKNGVSDFLSGGNPNQASEVAAKLLTRMTVGFPSAVARTVVEGGKRATLGAPTALKLFTKAARTDPAVRAQIIKESIKQFGSGATTGAIFYKLGQEGLVTGSYPTDPEERARWQREGITENSIKIGDNYYQLPSYLGSAALPALFAATLGRNNGDVGKSAGEVAKGLPAILPTDQASNVMDFINGRTDPAKFASQTGASAVRALEPGGALLNQIAKSFDSTANDTTSGSALENFMDKVLSGIPGVNNAAGIPDKTDDAGNVIHNPGALPLALGASSTTQDKGVQRSGELDTQTNDTIKSLTDTGAFNDPNLKAVLDDKSKKIYSDIAAGKQVEPGDIKKLQEAMAKGVSASDDSAYLEKEQYDTNLAALNIKRSLMAADPTTKPSDLKKMDLAIKRGQVYKDNQIPYDMISAYESTSLTDWRAMGDPESDSYDPDMYQKLYDVDNALTAAGGSYKKGDPAKNKYSAKKSGSGSGSGSKSFSSDFGTLKAGTGAPSVKQYETLDQASGSVPIIQVQRPNIVHKIGSSG